LWHEQGTVTQRQEWHQRIGLRKELAYNGRSPEIAAELAMHFVQSHDYQRAIQYLEQAGSTAMRRAAPQEAIGHVTTALGLLNDLPDSNERTQKELALRLMQGALLTASQGYAALEVGQTYTRARELCQQVGQPAQLLHILWGLYAFHAMRAEFEAAQALEGQIDTLAQSVADPALLMDAYLAFGAAAFHRGEYERACEQLAHGTAIPPPESFQASPLMQSAHDPWAFCLSYEAWALVPFGYPAQARERLDLAFHRASALAHPFSLVTYHEACCHVAYNRWEPQVVAEHAEAMVALATEHGFPQRLAIGQICRGWALAQQRQATDGIEQIRRGLATYQALGVTRMVPYFFSFLAEATGRGRQISEGLAAITEALELTQRTGERFHEAELYRLKGELLLKQFGVRSRGKSKQVRSSESEVEECFHKAIEIARRQSAKLYELRAAVSLGRLWQRQGKRSEAHKLLRDIYGWFTEGFDTKDLQEAKALLEELE
jgi:predicted ATPase